MKSSDHAQVPMIESQQDNVDILATSAEEWTLAPSLTRYWTLLVCPLLIGGQILMRSILEAGVVDDTFIFFRYAENVAGGLGPVFNAGEHVEGYTSPLWLLCLSILAKIHVDLVTVAPLFSALLAAITVVVLFYSAMKLVSPSRPILAIIPAMLMVTSPVFGYWAWSGLETALFMLLFLATFLTFFKDVRRQDTLFGAGLMFTLAALVRLDILVLLPVYLISIFHFSKENIRQLPKKYISFTLPLALLAVHFLWRYSYYNSWLPNTFYAKVGVPTESLLRSGLLYTYQFALAYAPYLVILLLSIVLVKSQRKWPAMVKLAIIIIIIWAAYVTWIGGDHFAMFRFYLPILPLIGLVVTGAVDRLVDRFAHINRRRLISLLLLIILLIGASNYAVYRRFEGDRARYEAYLVTTWSKVGIWLRQNIPSESSIASMVVGAIPYYSGLRTYDMLGLTDAHIARQGKVFPDGPVGHQKYDTDYILAQRPDFIIFPDLTPHSFTLPRNLTEADFSPYAYSFYDLLSDPRTWQLYESESTLMADGAYLSYLRLKQP